MQEKLFSGKIMSRKKVIERIGPGWYSFIGEEFEKEYMEKLSEFLKSERKKYKIRPDGKDTFRALKLSQPTDTNILMIGQDPYPHSCADGLAFSCKSGHIPPSLRRLFMEIRKDTKQNPEDPDLSRWAEQGILLLNKALTIRDGAPKSHHNIGWEDFIRAVVRSLVEYKQASEKPLVVICFGKEAQFIEPLIPDSENILFLKASHPARRGSYELNLKDKGYFYRIWQFLHDAGCEPITW